MVPVKYRIIAQIRTPAAKERQAVAMPAEDGIFLFRDDLIESPQVRRGFFVRGNQAGRPYINTDIESAR